MLPLLRCCCCCLVLLLLLLLLPLSAASSPHPLSSSDGALLLPPAAALVATHTCLLLLVLLPLMHVCTSSCFVATDDACLVAVWCWHLHIGSRSVRCGVTAQQQQSTAHGERWSRQHPCLCVCGHDADETPCDIAGHEICIYAHLDAECCNRCIMLLCCVVCC